MQYTQSQLAQSIDHTLLKADALSEEITKLCQEAVQFNFASVCVNPYHVALAAKLLAGSATKVCTVIGFPLGAGNTAVKAFEGENAVLNGAEEIDMVINIGALKDGAFNFVEDDIRQVVTKAKSIKEATMVKVIIETALLNQQEKVAACKLAQKAGADFVKTSTGFSQAGATSEDVKLMREVVGSSMGVKASGGIKNLTQAIAMLDAGATRLGTSSGLNLMAAYKGILV